MTMTLTRCLLVTALALLPAASFAQSADSAGVVGVMERFHRALAAGDSTGALALLAADVSILETGGVETRDAYRAGHLRGDIAFAQAVPSVRTVVRVTVVGDAAWVTSTSVTEGTYRDRPINSAGAELMVLRRERDGWRIAAVHWSSRTRR